MPTLTNPPADTDTRTVPGWERVLNAFMADPDRILTNVELGQVPGVQAFHQRISDMTRYGYVLTAAVKLSRGHYAYALLGVSTTGTRWSFPYPRPHADRLPIVADDHETYAATVEAAVAKIEARTDELLKRGQTPTVARPAGADRLRTLEQENAQLAADARGVVNAMQIALGDHTADWPDASRRDLHKMTRKTLEILTDGREVIDVLTSRETDAVAMLQDALPEERQIDLVDGGLLTLVQAACDEIVRLEAVARGLRADLAAAPARRPRADRGPSGPDLLRKALEFHEQPMHSAKIQAWVMENGGADVYKGKTPGATMAAQLATSNQKGGQFIKVAPGVYALREWEGKADEFGNLLLELDAVR